MIPVPQKFSWKPKEKIFFGVLILIGVISFLATLKSDQQRAWTNYLVNYFYWFSLGLSGLFFTALQYVSGSRWSATVRRVSEMFIGFLPISLLLFFVLLFGLHHLYEWTHHHVVEADAILAGKSPYLNTSFFVVRALGLYALCFLLGGWMIKNSIKQDQSGDVALTKKNIKLSAPFIFLFGWGFTFASVDLIMSLEPHWFSTIFGVYCWAGLFSSGLAMLILWALFLRRRGPLDVYFNEEHMHDLGKFLFAFIVFWGYAAFSQYMLIWYGNLPEETYYFLDRQKGAWEGVSIALMVAKFGVPFLYLIGRAIKRSEKGLVFICVWYLLAQWLDIYWMVYPSFFDAPVFGWSEIGLFLGFAGLFFLSIGLLLGRFNAVSIKDPYIESSLHYHQ